MSGNWVDDDGNVAWADQCVSKEDVAGARAQQREFGRIYDWLERIGAGVIPVPFGEMDKTKAVPIATWLAAHLRQADHEFPDERDKREARELRQAKEAATRAAERVVELQRRRGPDRGKE